MFTIFIRSVLILLQNTIVNKGKATSLLFGHFLITRRILGDDLVGSVQDAHCVEAVIDGSHFLNQFVARAHMPTRVIESQELVLIVLILANELGEVNMGVHDGGEPTGAYVVGLRVGAVVEIERADPRLQDGPTNTEIGPAMAIVLHVAAEDEPLGHVHRLRNFAEGLIIHDFDFQLRQEALSHAAVTGEDIERHDGAKNAVSDEFQFLIVEFLER